MNQYKIMQGKGSVIGAAIHSGHNIRQDLYNLFVISEEERLKEEDPFTDEFIEFVPSKFIVNSSRFEVDLNRPRDMAVYVSSEDAWGLNIWKNPPEENVIQSSLEIYDRFYSDLKLFLTELLKKNNKLFIYDIHSYNHRRNGKDAEPEDSELNPDINIGTGKIDREYWSELVNNFISDLQSFDYNGKQLDVRENVKFKGGYFQKWINDNFKNDICLISVEFKKFFMDEWTGKPFLNDIKLIKKLLASTTQSIIKNLNHKTGAMIE